MKFNPSAMRIVLEAWQRCELDPGHIVPTLTDGLAQCERITNESKIARAAGPEIADRIVVDLAEGRASMVEAVTAYSALTGGGRGTNRETVVMLHQKAIEHVTARVARELRQLGDSLIVEHIAPEYAALITEATNLAPKVAGITDDTAAATSDPKTVAAWARLSEIVAQLKLLVDARRALAINRILPPLDDTRVDSVFLAYQRPDLLPAHLVRLHPVARLLATINAGAGPGIYTSAQATEQQRQVERILDGALA